MLTKITGELQQEYFVHLGLHKTATTALQTFLHKSAAILLTHDVHFIPLQRMRAEITPLFCQMDKSRRSKLFDVLEVFPSKKMLLSDENILGHAGDIPQGVLYPFAGNRVLSFCEECGDRRVTLFLVLREPVAFVTSMYSEFIRHNEFISFDEYIGHFDVNGMSYLRIFSWLKKVPENTKVVVMPYEEEFGGGVQAIARRLVELACGPDSKVNFSLFPKERPRSSYSPEEIELATYISARAGGKMAEVFLNTLDARNKRFGSGKFSPLSMELVAKLRARYISELAVLCEASPDCSPKQG